MIKIVKVFLLTLILLWVAAYGSAAFALINIISAENVYGEVAKELGGPYVNVANILNNPTQDPHLFNINPSTAKMAAKADILIYNGADYDPWMKSLLTIKGRENRSVVEVSQLINLNTSQNPHIWYMPDTMPVFAQKMATILSQRDPEHRDYFNQQLDQFNQHYQVIFNQIKTLKKKYQHTPVIATEPLFNYMAEYIGLDMHGIGFQMNTMNDVPPTISQIKQFEADLNQHTVRVLIYNSQVANPLTKRMLAIAQKSAIPTVGVTEMLPAGTTYISWMEQQLHSLEMALADNHGQRKNESK